MDDDETNELMRYVKIDIYYNDIYRREYITLNLKQNMDYNKLFDIMKIKAISILYVFFIDNINILYNCFNIETVEDINIDKMVDYLSTQIYKLPANWANFDKDLLIRSCIHSYFDCCHDDILNINNKLLNFLKIKTKN
jgi:hypothetical protein